MARSEHCECVSGRFTCGYCLRNAKPWHYTLSNGSAIVGGDPDRFAASPKTVTKQNV